MSKHLLISGFEITIEAWVGDTEDGTATKIALPPSKVRPRDLGAWVLGEWPKIKQQLTEQVALLELQEVEAQLVTELKRAAGEAEEAAAAKAKPAKKAKATKKASRKANASDEEAALRERSYPSQGASST